MTRKRRLTLICVTTLSFLIAPAHAQASEADSAPLSTLEIVQASQLSALFIPALAEECSRRHPQHSAAWHSLQNAYFSYYREAKRLIDDQYRKTIGQILSTAEHNQATKQLLIDEVGSNDSGWAQICLIASNAKALDKIIQTYPLNGSEPEINELYRAIDDGRIDQLATYIAERAEANLGATKQVIQHALKQPSVKLR